MSEPAPSARAFSPLRPRARSRAWRAGAVVTGTVLLAVASRIEVPMAPVPMTMQAFAVTMIGALYGWRLGAITVLAWRAQGALGLPVFAGGAGGLAKFLGPTGGYLLAFPLAAALTGFLAERGWNGDRPARAFAAMLAGNAACLALGGALTRDACRGCSWSGLCDRVSAEGYPDARIPARAPANRPARRDVTSR